MSAPVYQARYGLMTHDSLILAVAVRIGADGIATSDQGFEKVREIRVARPGDLKFAS